MNTQKHWLIMIVAAGLLAAFPGCKKNDGGDAEDMGDESQATEVAGPPASVRLVNASAADKLDVYVDGALVASGLQSNAYERSRIAIDPGAHTLAVKLAGSTGNALASYSMDLAPDTDYTAVVVGRSTSLDVVATGDDLSMDNGGSVRFIHAVPGADNVDIKTTGGTMVADDVDFKAVSEYVTLPEGEDGIAVFSGDQALHSGPIPVNASRALSVIIAPDGSGVTYINIPERTN